LEPPGSSESSGSAADRPPVVAPTSAQTLDADVVVVGAGPAGAATAAHLCRAGFSVVLLDQKRFPRDKVCGDFVGPVALLELQRLGFGGRREYLRTNCVREAALFLDGEELIVRSLPKVEGMPAIGRVIPRIVLDQWLVETAMESGAVLLDGHKIQEVSREHDGVRVIAQAERETRSLRARVVVGADGSNSQMARVLRGGDSRRDRRIIAVRGYYTGVNGQADRADLYFSERSFPGYTWVFPTGDGEANVGVGMVLQTVPRTTQHLRELLLELVRSDRALAERLDGARLEDKIVGWPLATFDPRQPLVGDRMVLVGDAAGLINPLNGEGIQYALLSAQWAAAAVGAAIRRGDCSQQGLSSYARHVHERVRYDMALAQMIVALIKNRSLNRIWLGTLRTLAARARRDPAFADTAGGILVGVQPARDAASRRMMTAAVEQAVRSAAATAVLTLGHRRKAPSTPRRFSRTTVRNPRALIGWGAALAPAALELAGQAGADTLRRESSARGPKSGGSCD
jgi:geranylgeranyl reductase family protein